jgi:hypothetical protein
MTFEQLLDEGRQLQRPCIFLRPSGSGPIAGIWYERDKTEIASTGYRCWLTVDARFIPGWSTPGPAYISVFTDEKRCVGGRLEVATEWPEKLGTILYAHEQAVLPPIDAVFARGSEAVGEWLDQLGWERNVPYNDNFRESGLVREYERIWWDEFPLYSKSDIYAVLGGWHWPSPDDDWHSLIGHQLLILTLRDSEPWVEAWRDTSGEFKIIRRIT